MRLDILNITEKELLGKAGVSEDEYHGAIYYVQKKT